MKMTAYCDISSNLLLVSASGKFMQLIEVFSPIAIKCIARTSTVRDSRCKAR